MPQDPMADKRAFDRVQVPREELKPLDYKKPKDPKKVAAGKKNWKYVPPKDGRRHGAQGVNIKGRAGNVGRRKVILNDTHYQMVEAMAGYGMTQDKIARALDLSPSTFYAYKREDERLRQALENGLAKAEAMVGKALFEEAKKGSIAHIKWFEMTRLGKREMIDVTEEKRMLVRMPAKLDEESFEGQYIEGEAVEVDD